MSFREPLYQGSYTDYFSKEKVKLNEKYELELKPYGYKVFVKDAK